MIYRISNITDLLQIPPEHWDECMSDLRGVIISLHMLRAAASCVPGAKLEDPSDMCPYFEFEPDGKGEITPMHDGKALFSMKVTRDGAAQ